MNFYYFNTHVEDIEELRSNNFYGGLFIYDVPLGDRFTKIARIIDSDIEMKYLIAIRPYVVSPQYLCMLYNSVNSMHPGRLQINIVTGSGDIQREVKHSRTEYLNSDNKDFGGILGPVTDLSSNIDRSNYLIEYIDMINSLKTNKPDLYVSVTNEYVFNAAAKNNNKIIIPYAMYKYKKFNIENMNVMVAIKPILRKTSEELDNLPKPSGIWNKYQGQYDRKEYDYFTYSEFAELMDQFKSDGITEVLISSCRIEDIYNPPLEERFHIMNFVKQYNSDREF
jgi:hypothetical protein